jgi:cytochrome c oxidase subunit 3
MHPAEVPEGRSVEEQSAWPMLLGTAMLVLSVGLVLRGWVLWAGGLFLLLALAGWVHEGPVRFRLREEGLGALGGHSKLWWGTLLLILSEVVLFLTIYVGMFPHGILGQPFPPALQDINRPRTVAATLLLWASGGTAHLAHRARARQARAPFRGWLAATLLLGAAFLANQAVEYASLVAKGEGLAADKTANFFFALTGLHGLHVLAGLVALGVLLARDVRRWKPANEHSLGAATLYWHFVDAVWVLLYATFYLRLVG